MITIPLEHCDRMFQGLIRTARFSSILAVTHPRDAGRLLELPLCGVHVRKLQNVQTRRPRSFLVSQKLSPWLPDKTHPDVTTRAHEIVEHLETPLAELVVVELVAAHFELALPLDGVTPAHFAALNRLVGPVLSAFTGVPFTGVPSTTPTRMCRAHAQRRADAPPARDGRIPCSSM